MNFKNQKLEEFNEYIKYRKVAVIGLGVSNTPLIDYLYIHKANVTVFDDRPIDKLPQDIISKITNYGFAFSFGENSLNKLHNFDLIFRSPSCLPTKPELEVEAKRGAIVTTEIELLMKMCPSKIIGITGSDGKTTTTSLVNSILQKAGYKTFLGGNIGTPLFTELAEMTPEDIVVLELSSFQLMGMEVSPQIAAITNITPNHLNIHKDYEEYIEAKKNIFKHQDENGVVVLNYDNEITRNCSKEVNGKVVFFSSKEKLDNGYIVDDDIVKECNDKIRKHIISTDDIILRGKHNLENIATALAITNTLVDTDVAIEAIKEFKPVAHRIEFVREIDGIKWYNDSASSSPTRTLSGINAFKEDTVKETQKSAPKSVSRQNDVKPETKTETAKASKEEKQPRPAKEKPAKEKPVKEQKERPAKEKQVKASKPIEIITDPEEIKDSEERALVFLRDVFGSMDLGEVQITSKYNTTDGCLEVDFEGEDMGILIGKRGQTLDSLQYLTSLVVNKGKSDYIRVKLDTEDYRRRRKETLENLARGIAYKVKKTRKPVVLEPMNPYERRIIHSALQGNKFVETVSEGEEPYRHVVVKLKRY